MILIGLNFEKDHVGTCVMGKNNNILSLHTHDSLLSVCTSVLSKWPIWTPSFQLIHNNHDKWSQLLHVLCKTWTDQEQKGFFNSTMDVTFLSPQHMTSKMSLPQLAHQLCLAYQSVYMTATTTTTTTSGLHKVGKALGIAILTYLIFRL